MSDSAAPVNGIGALRLMLMRQAADLPGVPAGYGDDPFGVPADPPGPQPHGEHAGDDRSPGQHRCLP
jgi:hypothetical protein